MLRNAPSPKKRMTNVIAAKSGQTSHCERRASRVISRFIGIIPRASSSVSVSATPHASTAPSSRGAS